MERYSKKRQAILDCLRATHSHPTAEWVYSQIKPLYPDLSLATVYRNLTQLKEAGMVRSMGSVAGQEHFDAELSPHAHLICERCGAINDLGILSLPPEWITAVREASGGETSEVRLIGRCRACIGISEASASEHLTQ